jgi:hypothetical protein
MTLTHLLQNASINPESVLVLRHRPTELGLRKVLPWLAHEQPRVFNAYQQHHGEILEKAMGKLEGKGHIASFIGLRPGEAVFAGFYEIAGSKSITYRQFWEIPEIQILKTHRLVGWQKGERKHHQWFDLRRLDLHRDWIGKLVVAWPPPERSWWRYADRNNFPIRYITEESLFAPHMPDWRDLVLTWAELDAIPTSWRNALGHWRGIYMIHDTMDGKNYVGSAGGGKNLLGRWRNYAESGNGGNKHLISRKPETFLFSILERVSPDMPQEDIVELESTWKQRLHTLHPAGLNAN